MRTTRSVVGFAFAMLGAGSVALAGPANPGGIAYGRDTSNVSSYGHPTGLVVSGFCNSDAAEFQNVRSGGGEVLQFLDPVDVPEAGGSQLCPFERNWYEGDPAAVPLWPFPSYGARQSAPGHRLADLTVGSAWVNSIVVYVSQLMQQNKVDGIFLDMLGARLPGMANWDSWSQREKDAYTRGAVDLVRRLDAARRAINPRFIIMSNNMWDRGDALGLPGEAYVDGVCIEHHPASEQWSVNYAGRKFSDLGHRRVLAIGRGTQDALAWSRVPGVTHVSDQWAAQYGHPNPPLLPFVRLKDR